MTITWSLVAKIMSAQTDRDCHEGCGCERAPAPAERACAQVRDRHYSWAHQALGLWRQVAGALLAPVDSASAHTESIAFTKIHPRLMKRGVELLGLSIDSDHGHIAWVRHIETS